MRLVNFLSTFHFCSLLLLNARPQSIGIVLYSKAGAPRRSIEGKAKTFLAYCNLIDPWLFFISLFTLAIHPHTSCPLHHHTVSLYILLLILFLHSPFPAKLYSYFPPRSILDDNRLSLRNAKNVKDTNFYFNLSLVLLLLFVTLAEIVYKRNILFVYGSCFSPSLSQFRIVAVWSEGVFSHDVFPQSLPHPFS